MTTNTRRTAPTRNGGGGTPSAAPFEPDAKILETARARTLLELAGTYTRLALDFPTEIDTLRVVVANLMLEVAMLRARVDELERKTDR